MRKIIVLSFDDGTIYDKRFIEILNKYQIPCTFNLNSGLKDYVWYCNEQPIRRFDLEENPSLYQGHEVASHTVTHPYLTELTEEELICEVECDCKKLQEIFGGKEIGFAVPLDRCGEREIEIIRKTGIVKYIRLPKPTESFEPPKDAFRIGCHGLYNEPGIKEKIAEFAKNTLPVSVFILAGHSYEFEVNNHWAYIEELLQYMQSFDNLEFMTMLEMVNQFVK
uniref:polysaccharide deacetylase family protein n=1 Tax=Acetatifactor sp. TaxID=1872090 RepID=UPI0040573C9A